jgi:hypothetical protein
VLCELLRWWQVPYFWFGIKAYDLVAGSRSIKSSYLLSKSNALELFPMLRGDKLCGAIVYYDGISFYLVYLLLPLFFIISSIFFVFISMRLLISDPNS